jgi:hypothetical protein
MVKNWELRCFSGRMSVGDKIPKAMVSELVVWAKDCGSQSFKLEVRGTMVRRGTEPLKLKSCVAGELTRRECDREWTAN